MEFTEMRKSKEEREAEKARKQQIRNLWQSAGVTDIRGVNNLIDEMTGKFPAPMIAPRG